MKTLRMTISSVTLLFAFTTLVFANPQQPTTLFNIPVKTLEGTETTLASQKGKVLLIVNTASKCGYTPQYETLEKVYEKYRSQGFEVLGFPSNDFGGQEPGTSADIRYFCKGTYHVTFPLFEKGSVSGDGIQPLYRYLLSQSSDNSPVKWNFEKFLIGRDGKVIKRFRSPVKPDSTIVTESIEAALKAAKTEK